MKERKSIAVCTIVAKNYLAFTKTLAESFQRFHPTLDFRTLVVDILQPPVQPLDLEKVVIDSPLDFLDTAQLNKLAYGYDITEFCTAIKPFYLEHLLHQGYEKVIYLDPDILILQPLDFIFEALETSNIVLIPHILDPIPLDNHLPNEITFLQSGAYNLGFLGVLQSQETLRFLNWWKERLEKYCHNAIEKGLFVDQKWIDLVPSLFNEVQILKKRGYNVAYWNLNTRNLSEQDGEYWVDDEPLVFFHFSGFNPSNPTQFSKHQTRLEVKEIPILAKLLQHYSQLVKASGHNQYKQLPYGYSTFSNGVPIDSVARFLFRQAHSSEVEFLNFYDVDGDLSFFNWLNEPVARSDQKSGSPFITNYLFGLYKQRLDLQIAFPDVLNKHHDSFLSWASQDAIKQGVHPTYVQAASTDISDKKSSLTLPGVNVAGYLTTESGVGEATRGYVSALKSLKAQVSLIDFSALAPSRKNDDTLSGFSTVNPHLINLTCINADQVPRFVDHVGSHYFEQKYNVGVWWWELPSFPSEWWGSFTHFQEIWVGSTFAYQSVSQHSPVPVVKVPPVVEIQLSNTYDKKYFELAENEFVFLFIFDFFSNFERKNPVAVVKAFRQAFQPHEPVRLVLKCINGEADLDNFDLIREAIGDAQVTIIDQYLSKDEKNGLISACDCYVSLHRSEGFGLTIAEAMFLKKPVIATGWSGNMDFMTVNNSYVVEHELSKLTRDYGPYKQGQVWASPNIEHAAWLMREVYEQPEVAKKKAQRASVDIRAEHSPVAVAEVVKARLNVVQHSQRYQQILKEMQLIKEMQQYQGRIAAMESSKFWKLRMRWFKLKKLMGLKTDNQ